MADKPGDAGQLACAIGDTPTDAGNWTVHAFSSDDTCLAPAILANLKLFANQSDRVKAGRSK
jgi:hypothetical protein